MSLNEESKYVEVAMELLNMELAALNGSLASYMVLLFFMH